MENTWSVHKDMPTAEELAGVKGDRTMSQGFVAQYAAEAALQTEGVAALEHSVTAMFKESFGVEHEGKGVRVQYDRENEGFVTITVYPVVFFGTIVPEVAWAIQEHVKADVERFTGLQVEAVNVHVSDIIPPPTDSGGE